ncbi:MAG: hypothetical protein H9855_01150 [Candidatus Acinetobacter avistercoris]|nr:hypothetical protein [Candidatus Acinetobacter avistercoris]
MGCSNLTHLSPTVPSNLLQPVDKLQKLESTQGKAVMLWSIDTVAKYNQCSAQVDAFIEINKPSK